MHFTAIPSVSLIDQFETATASVSKPEDICPPANKNNEGIHDPATHEEAYQIRPTTPHVPQTNLTVKDQFGTLQVDTVKPERPLVPTNEGLGSAPAGPPAPGVADHYKCYRIKVTSGTTKFLKGTQATVVDQFQTRLYAHLICYTVKPAHGQAKTVRVVGQIFTDNQFGPGRVDTVKEDELCRARDQDAVAASPAR